MDQKQLFKEVSQGYTMLEAVTEAKRCLHCKVPLCQKGCPIENDIPEWIHELSKGNIGNALSIIHQKSNLPAVCGRVCPHERQCEGHCVLTKQGQEPVRVGKLERFIADFDGEIGFIREKLLPKTRGRVAVIGSGPAGLSLAGDLARMGFNVEIYESEPEAGGVLMFGIPEYRLPKHVVRREIKKIEELGVIFHCNTTIGPNFTIDQLFDQLFDAIFIGTGTMKPSTLDIPGAHLDGVRQAVYFLRRCSLYNEGSITRDEVPVQEGDRVFVIGCGNTAMDSARTAVRLGAKQVEIVYRRTIDEMSALRSEYEEAVEEGVKFNWKSNIVEIKELDGEISSVVIEQEGERRETKADIVIMAVGSMPESRIVTTTKGIDVDDRGYVLTRKVPYGMTTRKGVFAGGDVVTCPSTVVEAMRDAKKVALGIAQYVDAMKLIEQIDMQNDIE